MCCVASFFLMMFAVCFPVVARRLAQAGITPCRLKLGCLGVLAMGVWWCEMTASVFRSFSILTWGVEYTWWLMHCLYNETFVTLRGYGGFTWYAILLRNDQVLLIRELTLV